MFSSSVSFFYSIQCRLFAESTEIIIENAAKSTENAVKAAVVLSLLRKTAAMVNMIINKVKFSITLQFIIVE